MVGWFGWKAKLNDPLNAELAGFLIDCIVAGCSDSQLRRLGARLAVFFQRWGISSERDARKRMNNAIAFVEAQFGKSESLDGLKRYLLRGSPLNTAEQTPWGKSLTTLGGFETTTPFVFLSYARRDRDLIMLLRECLLASGIAVWVDSEIEIGDHWSNDLQAQLEAAFAVLVLWTVNSRASDWVNKEADFARSNDKLFQAQVGHHRAPPRFRDQQIVDLTDWTGEMDEPEWVRMESALKSRLATVTRQTQP